MIIPDYVERHARLYPEKKAVIFEDRQCTYLELQERVYRLANGLMKLGLKEEDRVAVLAENCFEFLEIYMGVAKAGGIVAPLNYRLLPRDITHLLNYVETDFLILGANYADMIRFRCDPQSCLTTKSHIATIAGINPEYDLFARIVRQSDRL